MEDPIFIDVEASALAGGYPIEVGWAGVSSPEVQMKSFLIDDRKTLWPQTKVWDQKAEQLHGIARAELTKGMPPSSLSKLMNVELQDKTVISDIPSIDRQWIDMVFASAGSSRRFEISEQSAATLIVALAAKHGTGDLDYTAAEREARRRAGRRHRAGPDAAYWAHLWLLVQSGFRAGPSERPGFGPLRLKP